MTNALPFDWLEALSFMVKIQYCLFRSVLNLFRKTHDVKRRDLRLFNIIFSKANGQLRENER